MSIAISEKKNTGFSKNCPPKLKKVVVTLLLLIVCGVGGFLLLLGVVLQGSRDGIQGNPEIMIVLGCQVMPSGTPSQSLADRLNKALSYWAENPEILIIVSGGQGDNEPTTEAYAMAQYLINGGVDQTQIFQEGNSRNTHQNLSYTMALMVQEGLTGDIVIVSSGFHLTRAKMLWGRVGGDTDTLSLLAAPVTHQASFIKSHIREPLALVKSFLFDQGQVALP